MMWAAVSLLLNLLVLLPIFDFLMMLHAGFPIYVYLLCLYRFFFFYYFYTMLSSMYGCESYVRLNFNISVAYQLLKHSVFISYWEAPKWAFHMQVPLDHTDQTIEALPQSNTTANWTINVSDVSKILFRNGIAGFMKWMSMVINMLLTRLLKATFCFCCYQQQQ